MNAEATLMEIASSALPPRNDMGVGRYVLLTFQNTGAGPFSGSLIPLLHAARGM
jgi:hypothetical protein